MVNNQGSLKFPQDMLICENYRGWSKYTGNILLSLFLLFLCALNHLIFQIIEAIW